ncbi:MAG TPA: hypothetical protein DDX29_10095 [Clostridiales bacterium]|nr:hypothetical protein [Clostridiales bacterium]
MYQLIITVLTFMLIPLLIRFKVKLGYAILTSAIVLGMVSGIGMNSFFNAVIGVFKKSSSQNTILVVTMVSILGGVMKHYGILEVIVDTMQKVIGSKRNIIIIIPAMVGILTIPGGALLSAPFVNRIGEEIDLSPPRRAAINLVFRHLAMFILPFSTSIIIVPTILPNISIPFLILLNSVFVAGIVISGYFMFLKDIRLEKVEARERTFKNVLKLFIYISPIYTCVVITGITGIPFYLSMFASLLIVYILGDKKVFLKTMVKSINYKTVITVTSVLIMQSTIMQMTEMLEIFIGIFQASDNFFTVMLILLITSTFFGFMTGYIVAALAITLPLIAQLNVSYEMLHVYVYIATGCAFIGYFFSPLHLCQAFTVQIMGVSTLDLYKEYRLYAPLLILILVVSAFVFSIIL